VWQAWDAIGAAAQPAGDAALSRLLESDDRLLRMERCDDRSVELVRLADVPGPDPFSEGQLLGLELTTKLRALALRVPDQLDAGRRCDPRRRMFAIDPPHRVASAPGHMRHAMTSSIIPEQSQRKAVIQPASKEAPRRVRKNRLRYRKANTSNARNRHNFGASTCSKHDSRTCAEQNHLREKIGKIAKPKNRLQLGSDAQRIASL
jgi:hypothetical protein